MKDQRALDWEQQCLHGISKDVLLWKQCLPVDANASFWHVFISFWMQCYILKEMWGILRFVCAVLGIVCRDLKKRRQFWKSVWAVGKNCNQCLFRRLFWSIFVLWWCEDCPFVSCFCCVPPIVLSFVDVFIGGTFQSHQAGPDKIIWCSQLTM